MQNVPVDNPQGGDLKAFKAFFEETEVVKRDKLKPQWLRDFQDSQRRGQSAPS